MHCFHRWSRSVGLVLATALALPAATVREQWADLPEYGALIGQPPAFLTPPRLLSGEPPPAPAFLEPDKTVSVDVVIAISEQGDVAAARVARSDDPRLDAPAVEAILRWKFAPAEGAAGPVKAVALMPLRFVGSPPEDQQAINVTIGAFSYDTRHRGLLSPVLLSGATLGSVKAARVVVESAVDDTGAELNAGASADFLPMAVGRVSPPRGSPALSSLNISLRQPAPGATQLRSLQGRIELIVPSLDPAATAIIDQFPTKLNRPCPVPALAAAGITITLLDRAGAARALADPADPSGARSFLTNELTAATPGWKNPCRLEMMTEADVAIAISDPEGRLAALEFETAYGKVVRFNPWSHFEISPRKRFSIYRLERKPAADLKIVCWLVTPTSTVRKPMVMANLPLPPPPL